MGGALPLILWIRFFVNGYCQLTLLLTICNHLFSQTNRMAKQIDFLVQCMSGSKSPPNLPTIDSPEEGKF